MNEDSIIGMLFGGIVVWAFYQMKNSGMLADAWKFIKNPSKY